MPKILIKRGTSTQWNASTTALLAGELGLDTSNNILKVGNGTSLWNSLSGLTLTSTQVSELAQDAISTALSNGTHSNITVTYNDNLNSISLATGPDVVTTTSLSNTLTNPSTGYVTISDVGNPDGVAPLDENSLIPDAYIPSTIARDSELFSGSYNDLTDKPTIPSLTGYATETYVGTAISNLVDSAPTTLNTLNELAAALGDDANYATTISTALGNKLDSSTASSTYAPINNPVITGKLTVNGTNTSYLASAYSGYTGDITLDNTGIYISSVDDAGGDGASVSVEAGILSLSGTVSGSAATEMYLDNGGVQIVRANGANSLKRLEIFGAQGTTSPLLVTGNTTTFTGTVDFGSSTLTGSGFTYASITIPVYTATTDLPAASANHGRWAHVHGEGAMYFAHGGSWYKALSEENLKVSTNAQSGSYTLATTDLDKMIEMSGGGTLTITDSSSFPVGFTCNILQTGSSQVTVAGSGFTPNATPGLKLRTQWSSATLVKRALNSWVLMGDLSA